MHDYIEQLKSNFDKGYHIGPTGRLINNAELSGNAGDFLDAWFTAKTTVTVYEYPGGPAKAIFYKGDIMGKAYSYKLYGGKVWYQLDGPDGKHFAWVPLVQGTIEPDFNWSEDYKEFQDQIKESDRTVIDDITDGVKSLGSGVGDTLKSFGDNLNTIIILVIVGIAVYTFFYAKKTLAL